jgi:TRAP-type C4-dicarboxylate transport system permease small subunit
MERSEKSWGMVLIKNYDFFFAGIALFVLVIITFGGVPMRYVFNKPLIWQQEIQLTSAVWIIFWGSGGVFRTGGHVAIEVLVDILPLSVQKIIRIAGWIISTFIIGYLCLQSCILIRQLHVSGRVTDILKIPFPYIYAVVPIGCITMIVNSGYKLIKEFRGETTALEESAE